MKMEFQHRPIGEYVRLFEKDGVLLGATPSPDSLKELADQGVKRVISVQHSSEMDWEEQRDVEAMGMEFYHYPIAELNDFSDPSLAKIRNLLEESDQYPVLFHCSAAIRVSAVWIAFRVLDQNVDFKTAFEETQSVCPIATVWHKEANNYIFQQQNAVS